jgi:hypothetical protein
LAGNKKKKKNRKYDVEDGILRFSDSQILSSASQSHRLGNAAPTPHRIAPKSRPHSDNAYFDFLTPNLNGTLPP